MTIPFGCRHKGNFLYEFGNESLPLPPPNRFYE